MRVVRVAAVAGGVLVLFDSGTTLVGLELGIREGNPLGRIVIGLVGPVGLVVVRAVVGVGVFGLADWRSRSIQ